MRERDKDTLEKHPFPILLLLVVMGAGFGVAGNAGADVPNDVCANCHEQTETFHQTLHGIYFSEDSDLMEYGCESCHGSAVEHIDEGDPEKIINPANRDQFGGDYLCLNCHRDHQFDEWSFSAHNGANVGCSGCHTIHVPAEQSVKNDAPELCYGCHTNVRAAAFMPSRHPIAESKMSCIDCHNVHGGQTSFARNFTNRELCFSCHAEKEGPFVYEHAPVNEDCMICHTAHGSVANNLLKQAEPALCLNCHPMHFHATIVGLDGTFVPPADSSLTVNSTPDGWKRSMLTKCSQCHSSVHGGDLPSQSISTGGNALTR